MSNPAGITSILETNHDPQQDEPYIESIDNDKPVYENPSNPQTYQETAGYSIRNALSDFRKIFQPQPNKNEPPQNNPENNPKLLSRRTVFAGLLCVGTAVAVTGIVYNLGTDIKPSISSINSSNITPPKAITVINGEPEVEIITTDITEPLADEIDSSSKYIELEEEIELKSQLIQLQNTYKSWFAEYPLDPSSKNPPNILDDLTPEQSLVAITLASVCRDEALPGLYLGEEDNLPQKLVMDLLTNDIFGIISSFNGEVNKNRKQLNTVNEYLSPLFPNWETGYHNSYRFSGLIGISSITELITYLNQRANPVNHSNETDTMLLGEQFQTALGVVKPSIQLHSDYMLGKTNSPFSSGFVPLFIGDPYQDVNSVEKYAQSNQAVDSKIILKKQNRDGTISEQIIYGNRVLFHYNDDLGSLDSRIIPFDQTS